MGNPGFSRSLKDQLITVARRMRAEPTLAEQRQWHHLRDQQLGEFRFRRQHIINRFIVDFYCPKAKLIIEVDGGLHKKQVLHDKERDSFLQGLGYRVIRFWNHEIFTELPDVLNKIHDACARITRDNNQQSPFPFQGEGQGDGVH